MVEMERTCASVRCVTPAKWFVVLAVAAAVLCPSARGAPLSPFNYADADLFGNLNSSNEVSSQTTSVFVQNGTIPVAYSEARARFGSNGIAVQGNGTGRGAGAGSIWSDGFTIAGGMARPSQLSVQVDGSIAGGTDMSYALFASTSPFDVQNILDAYENGPGADFNPQVPGALRLLYTAIANGCGDPNMINPGCGHVPIENFAGSLNLTLAVPFPFADGVTYYLASVFSADVHTLPGPGGSADFFNSATFGISVPLGATLTTTSNTVYAAAVPEPTSLALLAAAALGFVGCPRRARRTT